MKHFALLLAMLTIFIAGIPAEGADIALPEPMKTGGVSLFDVLNKRASASHAGFPKGKISRSELSTILWASSGLNRKGEGWTVPMAMGKEPYCRVYVLEDDASYLYDWKYNSLRFVSAGNLKQKIASQTFARGAATMLLFVTDGKKLAGFNTSRSEAWGDVLVGAMTQNVYLAAYSLGIGTRYIASLNEQAVRASLTLNSSDRPICIMPLGKY